MFGVIFYGTHNLFLGKGLHDLGTHNNSFVLMILALFSSFNACLVCLYVA